MDCPITTFLVLGIQAHTTAFYMGIENLKSVPMFAQQELYQMSHLSSPKEFFNIKKAPYIFVYKTCD